MKRWFPFLAIDYRSAALWLNERAKEGYRLTQMGALLPISYWEAAETPKQYAVTLWRTEEECLSDPEQGQSFEEFREFVAGLGWKYIDDWGNMRIFEGDASADLAPFHTDSRTEYQAARKLLRRRAWIDLVCIAIIAAACVLIHVTASVLAYLSYNCFLAGFFGIAVLLCESVWLGIVLVRQLHRDKRAAEEESPLSVCRPEKAWRRGQMYFITNAVLFLILAVGWFADVLPGYYDIRFHWMIVWCFLVRLVASRRLYRRMKWVRPAALVAAGALVFALFTLRDQSERLEDVREESRSVLLHRLHYYFQDEEECFFRATRYDSPSEAILTRAYEEFWEDAGYWNWEGSVSRWVLPYQEIEIPGYTRAAVIPGTQEGQYRTSLFLREGQLLYLGVIGMGKERTIEELLLLAEEKLR